MSESVELRSGGGLPSAVWLRQEGETLDAYTSFVVYREQAPPRSLQRVADEVGLEKRTLERHSAKYHWVDRATAYTDHLDRLSVATHEDEIVRLRRETNDRVFAIAREIQETALQRIVGVKDGETVVVPRIEPGELDPDDVIRWFETSVKAQRTAIGLPSDASGQIMLSLNDLLIVMRRFFTIAEERLAREDYEMLVRETYAALQERLGA